MKIADLPVETVRAVVADYQAGASAERIAKALGASQPTVLRLLRLQGVPIRPKHELIPLPPVGAVFGATTVVGPADIPYTVDASGNRNYRVRVECWSCKATRDVRVASLRHGSSRMCKRCASSRNGPFEGET